MPPKTVPVTDGPGRRGKVPQSWIQTGPDTGMPAPSTWPEEILPRPRPTPANPEMLPPPRMEPTPAPVQQSAAWSNPSPVNVPAPPSSPVSNAVMPATLATRVPEGVPQIAAPLDGPAPNP